MNWSSWEDILYLDAWQAKWEETIVQNVLNFGDGQNVVSPTKVRGNGRRDPKLQRPPSLLWRMYLSFVVFLCICVCVYSVQIHMEATITVNSV